MVAISLYRGNLHRVPDVPRRWLMPARKISLNDFKSLLNRRTKALSRFRSSTSTTTATAIATTSYHNSDSKPNPNPNIEDNYNTPIPPPLEAEKGTNCEEEGRGEEGGTSKEVKDHDDVSNSEKPEKDDVAVNNGDENLRVEKLDLDDNRKAETASKVDDGGDDDAALNDKEKRKVEVEEKLQVLNQKKHNLVQVLKQILNVEEELKRRSSSNNNAQGTPTCSSVPLQVEATNDSGSISRLATPRMGSEANVGGDLMDGGETEDVSNHYNNNNNNSNNNSNNNNNNHSSHVKRMSSTSPSSESPLRKPPFIQHNAVPLPSRPSLGTTSSPSRFAPTGHQGPLVNAPTVSVSGTNYIASSPSPAASGGTSAFRDAQQPSPWN